ncbi:VanZ family protein, partial [Candidatus Woesebacteria bacterium]|nr:VanZ family protein [Candidatus Woesebacteria bacterium]
MNIQKLLWYWGPPIALMSIIFYLSSRQSIAVSDEFTVNFIVFKSLHLIEYALLFFLLFRAYYSTLSRNNMKRIFLYAFVTALLYAISDEMHQTLVPTRT